MWREVLADAEDRISSVSLGLENVQVTCGVKQCECCAETVGYRGTRGQRVALEYREGNPLTLEESSHTDPRSLAPATSPSKTLVASNSLSSASSALLSSHKGEFEVPFGNEEASGM